MAHSLTLTLGFLLFLLILGFWLWLRYYYRRGRPTATPFADIPLRTVDIQDWTIRYHQAGSGPYILLIHGIGANLFCWRHLIPLLQSRYTVVALDLPGFGGSSKALDQKYGLDDQVERLENFLTRLGIRKTYIVGNSMGGNIALWLTLTYPERILGTVVIAPATSPNLIPLPAASMAWIAKPLSRLITRKAVGWAHRRTVSKSHLVDADRIEETFKTYGQSSEAVRSFLLATESIRDKRLSKDLANIKGRVLILWGSRDRLVSRRVIDELEGQLKQHESHVHVGGGHHLQEDEPEWVSEKIDAFFAPQRH